MKSGLYAFLLIYLLFCCENAHGAINSIISINSVSEVAYRIDIDSIVFDYIDKADQFQQQYNMDSMKLWLDAAAGYEKDLENSITLGYFYSKYGDYFSITNQDILAHQYYYKSLQHYEKCGLNEVLIPIYHNLALSYFQKRNTNSLKKIIDKMLSIVSDDNLSDYINTYRVISFYYNCLYEKDPKNFFYLDSAIYYDKKVISIYESEVNLTVRDEDIAYNYLNLASNLINKKQIDERLVKIYLQKSVELMNKNDSTMIYNQYWVKGRIAVNQEKYKEAEKLFMAQLEIMDNWIQETPISMYSELFEMLAIVSEKQKKYEEALDYERKHIIHLQRIHDARNYEIVRELQTKYEVEKKEQAILSLTETNIFRKKLSKLNIFISILIFTVLFVVIRWQRQKKKTIDAKLEITRLEKHDALLQVRLKEELLKKIELEKYEALLAGHFKNEQISEMDEDIKGLREEQNQLNLRIKEYAEKVNKYENRKSGIIVFKTNNTYHISLLRDIYDLINKRLTSCVEKNDYIKSLLDTDGFFLHN